MNPWRVIFRREFRAYFSTPLAAVFLVVFLFMAGVFSFSIGYAFVFSVRSMAFSLSRTCTFDATLGGRAATWHN